MSANPLTTEDLARIPFNKITIIRLKDSLKQYKIKFKSNIRKQDLFDLLKKSLYESFMVKLSGKNVHVIKIQKCIRGKSIRKKIKYRGPGYFKRSLCTNDTDPISMEEINDIPDEHFISVLEEKLVYGYHLFSLGGMFKEGSYKSPYTRKEFSKELIEYVNNLYEIEIKKEENNSPQHSQETYEEKTASRIFNFFHKCYLITGTFVDEQWFIDLDRKSLANFYIGMEDLWNYRANLTTQMKEKYIPSNVLPTIFNKIADMKSYKYNKLQMQNIILDDFEKFINYPKDEDKNTTIMWILTVFVDISPVAQMNLPQLVQPY